MQVNGGTAFAFAPPVNNSMATDSRTRVQSALEHIAGHLKCSLWCEYTLQTAVCVVCWSCCVHRIHLTSASSSRIGCLQLSSIQKSTYRCKYVRTYILLVRSFTFHLQQGYSSHNRTFNVLRRSQQSAVVFRDCVLERLEGPGINKSICPQCSAPMWKKDLVRDIQIEQLLLITSRFCKEADRKASVECTGTYIDAFGG